MLTVIGYFVDGFLLDRSAQRFGSVEVRRYYAVHLKNGKTDLSRADSETDN